MFADAKPHKEKFKIFVRFRPINQYERDQWRAAGESAEDTIAFKLHAEDNHLVTVKSTSEEEEAWSFDKVLWYDVNQGSAFNQIGYQTIQGVLNGINGTIFAYGQVGTGKTYSLLGPEPLAEAKPNELGILPMAVQHIFRFLKKNSPTNWEITVSFLEVYMGNLKDLVEPLLSGKKEKVLKLLNMDEDDYRLFTAGHADKSQENQSPETTVITNLSKHPIKSIKQFYDLTVQAVANRTTNVTGLNATSSRGHMICQLRVKISRSNGIETVAKLNIVDLAGCENISKTKLEGRALTEATSINNSLKAFREVIDALAKGKHRVPYRESKLAMILKDSLRGNTQTSMLITLSPHKLYYRDSIANLKFGKRARFVANKVKVNIKLNEQELVEMMQQKDTEIHNLKNQLEIAQRQVEGLVRKLMNRTPDSQYTHDEFQDSSSGPPRRISKEALETAKKNDELTASRARSSNLVQECEEIDQSERRGWDVETDSREDLEQKKYDFRSDEVKSNRPGMKRVQSWSNIQSFKLNNRISRLEKRLESALWQRDREKQAKLKLERKFEKLRSITSEIDTGKRGMKRKHERKRKKSRARGVSRARAQTLTAEPAWKSSERYEENDNTEEKYVRKFPERKLPHRVKLERIRLKQYENDENKSDYGSTEKRQSVTQLTGLNSQRWESLSNLITDMHEETLKVWLMMMMSIQDIGGKGKHKLISLADFFNFHIELSWAKQRKMSIAQMFGILDNTNMGGISGWELSTFFQQVRRIDALKWGFSADHLNIEMSLSDLTEVIELSHFLSKVPFEKVDLDNDGLLSLDDVSAYFRKIGGRKWSNKGSDYSRPAIIEILTRVHLMKWQRDYWKIKQDFIFENPPGVTKQEFDYFLVKYSIPNCWLEIKDDLMETLPMEEDRFRIFKHLVPEWRNLFQENEIITSDTHMGLSIGGAQELVSNLRSGSSDDSPNVSERDIAVIYLQGLSQTQMEMVVRSCPVKIWNSLVDEKYQDSCPDRVEEFRKLEEKIANSLRQPNTEEDEFMKMGSI